ncbi:DUF6163 family protein [Methylosinus sporium]|uniref:DUF6163 family protein n=1 Tax=Methylosinus sporium TaxID=428 RepID=UPI00383B93C3
MTEHTLYEEADDPHRPIRLGDAGAAGQSARWGHMLTLFMRVMALFWLLQGVMQWVIVLTASRPIFDETPTNAAIAVVFFAVLDLVAGVGLWLATPWGGVLWLLIAGAQIFVTLSVPGFFAGGYWLIALDLALIGLYFFLTFEAGRDYEAQRLREKRRRRRGPEAEAVDGRFSRLQRQARALLSRFGR